MYVISSFLFLLHWGYLIRFGFDGGLGETKQGRDMDGWMDCTEEKKKRKDIEYRKEKLTVVVVVE